MASTGADMRAFFENLGRVLRAFLTRRAGPLPVWAWCAVALGVLLVVVVAVAAATSAKDQPSPALPASLTITWVQDGVTQFPLYVIAGAKYVLSPTLSPSTYTANMAAALPNATLLGVYTYAPDAVAVKYSASNPVVFVKYALDGARRFALVFDKGASSMYVVATADDVGSMTNPAAYTGAWTESYNGTVTNTTKTTSLQFA